MRLFNISIQKCCIQVFSHGNSRGTPLVKNEFDLHMKGRVQHNNNNKAQCVWPIKLNFQMMCFNKSITRRENVYQPQKDQSGKTMSKLESSPQ